MLCSTVNCDTPRGLNFTCTFPFTPGFLSLAMILSFNQRPNVVRTEGQHVRGITPAPPQHQPCCLHPVSTVQQKLPVNPSCVPDSMQHRTRDAFRLAAVHPALTENPTEERATSRYAPKRVQHQQCLACASFDERVPPSDASYTLQEA